MILSKKLEPNKIAKDSQGFPSTIMIEDLLKKLSRKEIARENFYRFCHELNKINFLLKNAKRIF